nr:MAG TPA: hypothetical protein [Caudoviricetes sp.]
MLKVVLLHKKVGENLRTTKICSIFVLSIKTMRL